MIRGIATLVGLACAAVVLLVPDVSWSDGGDLWKRAALLAAAGIFVGGSYQLGGIRRPSVRLNMPMLVGAWLPWSVLAVAICAYVAGSPSWLSRWVQDIVPAGALARWSPSFPILAFTSGLLLAVALIEPLVQQSTHLQPTTARPIAPAKGANPAEPVTAADTAETATI